MAFFVLLFMSGKKVIISEGNRPLWHRVIAAAHYTVIVCLLYFFFTKFEFATEKDLKSSFSLLELAAFLLPSALAFSVVKDLHFDLEDRKYKIQYCVGPIKFGKWQSLPRIDYVSIFKQPKADGDFIFEVNLWYKKNRHFNIYEGDKLEPVFQFGEHVAKILNANLLDATRPNNHKWVNP